MACEILAAVPTPRRAIRGPGVVFTAIAVAATLTLGVVALDASQSSPPAVAEFAPAALNQVKNAPNPLGAQGNPSSSPPTPSATPSKSATPTPSPTAALDQPAVRDCVGDPAPPPPRPAPPAGGRGLLRCPAPADRGPTVTALRQLLEGRQRRSDGVRR